MRSFPQAAAEKLSCAVVQGQVSTGMTVCEQQKALGNTDCPSKQAHPGHLVKYSLIYNNFVTGMPVDNRHAEGKARSSMPAARFGANIQYHNALPLRRQRLPENSAHSSRAKHKSGINYIMMQDLADGP